MILLVNPLPSPLAPFPERLSLSLGALASFLPQSQVEIFNDKGDENLFLSSAASHAFIGFTGMTYQAKRGLYLAGLVKARFPEKKTVFGGVHASLNIENILRDPQVDFVIQGEGEEPLRMLLNGNSSYPGIFKMSNEAIQGEPQRGFIDLQSLPRINRKLIPDQGIYYDQAFREKTAIVMFSRGCSGSCTFCASPVMFGRKPRFRTAEQAATELEYLVSDFGVNCFAIDDDNFLSDGEFASFFVHWLLKLSLKLRFRINCRLEDVSFGILKHLQKVGLTKITLGVEHNDPQILKFLGKNNDLHKLSEVLAWCNQLDLLCTVLLIAGAPGETRDTLRKAADWITELNPSGGYDFQILQPHPGHPIEKICLTAGKILSSNTDDFFSDNITFLPAGFNDPLEFRDLVRKATGKPVKIAGIKEKSISELLKTEGAETLIIDPSLYSDSDFNLETTHWQGSERCNSGLSILKCLNHGGIEYSFSLKDTDLISGLFLHGRFASHPVGFPKGEQFSSEIRVILNGMEVSRQIFKSIHTVGEYLKISIFQPGILKTGSNTIRLEVPADSKFKNGLSIFYKPLNPFFEPYEMPLILEIIR